MQGELHETIKRGLPHMPLLNRLWANLDAVLNTLDNIELMLEVEKTRKTQAPLLAQETDDYYRQLAYDND
jgi:hypothetical protein